MDSTLDVSTLGITTFQIQVMILKYRNLNISRQSTVFLCNKKCLSYASKTTFQRLLVFSKGNS